MKKIKTIKKYDKFFTSKFIIIQFILEQNQNTLFNV